jgi:hypothetical protein
MVKKEKKIERRVQLVERTNGKITKNQSIEINDFIESILLVKKKELNNIITHYDLKDNWYNRIFKKKTLEIVNMTKSLRETFNLISLRINHMIEHDNIHTTKKRNIK